MKNTSLTILFFIVSFFAISQDNFVWDKVIDIDGEQYDLFLRAKQYISDNKGTQFADEKSMTVTAYLKTKGRYEATSVIYNNLLFEYKLIILTKPNKIRIIINDIVCTEKKYLGMKASVIYPEGEFDLEPKKYYSVMKGVQEAINLEVQNIESALKTPFEKIDNNW